MKNFETITSRANQKIRDASALLQARERKKTGLFIAEGARLCEDAAINGTEILRLFITKKAAETYSDIFSMLAESSKEVYFIDGAVAEKLSDTEASQNIFCVCRQRKSDISFEDDGFYLMTDNIQNPDNLGALSRSAEAFGAKGLIVSGGCDIYSPKALRASMGALVRFPVVRTGNSAEKITELKKLGFKALACVPDSGALDVRLADKSGKTVLVIGNEGAGISEEAKKECTGLVTIPMAGRAESLNAAAAGAVMMWEFSGRK
ncbi:MAG: RNA methyltransferase [Oscillospiraceae bacterium]|nr:RNA methyltransferase [Oscillospiraceae bacterium]